MPEVFVNHPPEAGFLQRVRSWRDMFPWLILGSCLRPAVSATTLLITTATLWIAALLTGAIFGGAREERVIVVPGSDPGFLWTGPGFLWTGPVAEGPRVAAVASRPDLRFAAGYYAAPSLRALSWGSGTRGFWRGVFEQTLLMLLWMIPAGYVLRQSILHVAGRESMGVREGVGLMARRSPGMLVALILPILAVAICVLYFLLPGLLVRWFPGAPWLGDLVALLGMPLLLAAGMLGFGALAAIPLSWAAVAAETEGDGFDAVSRGYEYLYRRPLQLAFYLLLAWLISWVAAILVSGIVEFGLAAADRITAWTAGTAASPLVLTGRVARSLPPAFSITLFWSLLGGIYLLLRRDANGKEVEDVWEAPQPPPLPLPSLPDPPTGSAVH